MNNRIKKLRQKSLDAVPTISLERAKLLTDFYKSGVADGISVPVARAMAFQYILENKVDHRRKQRRPILKFVLTH